MSKKLIHKYKNNETTECGKNIKDHLTTVMDEKVTCSDCKEVMKYE